MQNTNAVHKHTHNKVLTNHTTVDGYAQRKGPDRIFCRFLEILEQNVYFILFFVTDLHQRERILSFLVEHKSSLKFYQLQTIIKTLSFRKNLTTHRYFANRVNSSSY